MHLILSSQFIILHETIIPQINGKFKPIALQQPNFQKLSLKVFKEH